MDSNYLKKILPIAKKQGLLKGEREANECLIPSLNSANYLLYLIEQSGENGLSTSQLSHHLGFSLNTIRCYTRELEKLGLIERQRAAQENVEALWLFRGRK